MTKRLPQLLLIPALMLLATNARADEPAAQLKKFLGPKFGLPAAWSKVHFGQSEAEFHKAVPAFGDNTYYTPEGFDRLSATAQISDGVLVSLSIDLSTPGVDKVLTALWGKPTAYKTFMEDDLRWYDVAHGLRAKLKHGFADENGWTVVFEKHTETKTLFPKGLPVPPLDLAKGEIGMSDEEIRKAIPAFAQAPTPEFRLGNGYEDVSFAYWKDADTMKVCGLDVKVPAGTALAMLTAAWGQPKLDGNKRPYWVNPTLHVRVGDQQGLRATLLTEDGEPDRVYFSAESLGDYTP